MFVHECLLWLLASVTGLTRLSTGEGEIVVPQWPECRENLRDCPFPYCEHRPTEEEIIAPGVGIALEMAHGCAVIRYHNGTYQHVACVEGDQSYVQMMVDLALGPYPRKSLSNDTVEVLADMVQALRTKVEASLYPETVVAAAISSPDHVGLRCKEATAVLERLSIRNAMYGQVRTADELTTSYAAYAGSGEGLCKNYLDANECDAHEACLPARNYLQIDLSMTSLSAAMVPSIRSYHSSWPDFTFLNTSLGTNKLSDDRAADHKYWLAVQDAIHDFVQSLEQQITYLILTGSSGSSLTFEKVVKDALYDLVSRRLILDLLQITQTTQTPVDPIWLTARGAAEIAKRRQEGPFRCLYAPIGPQPQLIWDYMDGEVIHLSSLPMEVHDRALTWA